MLELLKSVFSQLHSFEELKEFFTPICKNLEYVGMGEYSTVYAIGNLIIKISKSDDFSECVTPYLDNPFFKRCAPKVFYVHHKGFVLICERVKRSSTSINRDTKVRIMAIAKKHHVGLWDLHDGNIWLVKGWYKIIDYGCFLPVRHYKAGDI